MNTAYIDFNGKLCVAAPVVLEKGLASLPLWKKWSSQAKGFGFTTRPGGNGRPSLIELNAIPQQHRERIIETLGNPAKEFNALEEFFTMDAAARAFYDKFRHTNGKSLEHFQISKYTINASVLNALAALRTNRETMTKRLGNPRRDLTAGLAADCADFNNVLKLKHNGLQHNLPKNARKLNDKLNRYIREGYNCLIDGRANNTNAQIVTPEMLQLWNEMFAGQRHKPTHIEVSTKYAAFLKGKIQIIKSETGELLDHKADCYREVSDSSVYNWLAEWNNRIGVFKARAGNRKTYMDRHTPSARMLRPSVGAIISVDDFQPPFKYADVAGGRIWFYTAQDLGSTAIVSWVYGDAKEGIITEFYRQMVRDYAALGLCLPYEIECEASLNSSFVNTFLSPGAMFSKVRVLRNKPRAKRIERTIRDLRLEKASKHPAFIARHTATDENYQEKPGKQIFLKKEEIIELELGYIEDWNNEPHPDQDLYPGMSRWDVFMAHQNPKLTPINWKGILPHIGNCTPTSMRLGRITLQGIDRVIGFDGEVATGTNLLNVMNEIEGRDVRVYWLDDNNGNVLKAYAYNYDGRFICEVLDDLPFHRSEIDQTEQCKRNMQLYFAYEKTVDAHADRLAKGITGVELIETEQPKRGSFQMRGQGRYNPVSDAMNPEIIEQPIETEQPVLTHSDGLNIDNF